VNRIAAGEVIERTASVAIMELLDKTRIELKVIKK
jgi:DNA mismatch repair ATPase MutL